MLYEYPLRIVVTVDIPSNFVEDLKRVTLQIGKTSRKVGKD